MSMYWNVCLMMVTVTETYSKLYIFEYIVMLWLNDVSRVQLKCDGTRTHGRGSEGETRMEWVASTLHTTSENGVSSITTADAHSSAANSLLNWRPRRFKWTRPFRRKTKYGFCACAITFQTQSTTTQRDGTHQIFDQSSYIHKLI